MHNLIVCWPNRRTLAAATRRMRHATHVISETADDLSAGETVICESAKSAPRDHIIGPCEYNPTEAFTKDEEASIANYTKWFFTQHCTPPNRDPC